jgi:hypothetical protein
MGVHCLRGEPRKVLRPDLYCAEAEIDPQSLDSLAEQTRFEISVPQ